MPHVSQAVAQQPATASMRVESLDPTLSALIAPEAVPSVAAGPFIFTEAPLWFHGRLWFVDEEGDKVLALAPDGSVSTLIDYQSGPYARPDGNKTGPNGMAAAPDGTVVAMQQYARDVVRLIPQPGNVAQPVRQEPWFHTWDGKHLNSPNDLVFTKDGTFYFTDPNYGLKLRDRDPAKQISFQGVFLVRDGKPSPVITDLRTPNGIALSPDGSTLYINNSEPDQRLIAYPVHADGSLGPGHNVITFTGHEGEGVPDGMKIDANGNLWATGPGGIRILTPQGHVLGQIHLPEVAANLTWGGADGRTLYITARRHVYQLRTLVRGALATQ